MTSFVRERDRSCITNLRDGNKTACGEVKTGVERGSGVNRLQTIASMFRATENRIKLAITM